MKMGRLLCLLAISFTVSAEEPRESVTLSYFSLPPHVITTLDESQPKGAAIDFFEKEIAPDLNVDIKWLRQPLTRSLQSLKEKTVDGVITLAKNPERQVYLTYPKYSYYKLRAGMLVLKSDKLNKINSVADLKGRRILLIQGWMKSSFVRENDSLLNLDYIYGDDASHRLISMLTKKRTTMVYTPAISTFFYNLKQIDKLDSVKALLLPGEERGEMNLYTAFSKSEKAKRLVKKYNTIMIDAEMKEKYMQYLQQHIGEVNYGEE